MSDFALALLFSAVGIALIVLAVVHENQTDTRNAAVAYCAEQNKLAQKSESAGLRTGAFFVVRVGLLSTPKPHHFHRLGSPKAWMLSHHRQVSPGTLAYPGGALISPSGPHLRLQPIS